MHRLIAAFAFAAVVALATAAQAQSAPKIEEPSLVSSHPWVLSVERLLGVEYDHESATESGMSVATNSTTTLGFFIPRVAVDRVVGPGISVGIAASAGHQWQTATPTGQSATSGTTSEVLLVPRVGYALDVAPSVVVWLRGGLTFDYFHVTSDNGALGGATSNYDLAATVEVPVVLAVFPRVAITVGPTLDVTFWTHDTIGEKKVVQVGGLAGVSILL